MKNTNTKQNSASLKMVVLFVFMIFAGSVSAQVKVAAADSNDTPAATASVEANSNINTVTWFMGTKQTPKAGLSNDGTSAKKQMINAGIAPNRLLLKVMLKKATDFQVATA